MFGMIPILKVKGNDAFTGYVKDRLGNPIAGASITLSDSQQFFIGSTTSNGNGYYSMSVSLSGNSPYLLSVGKTGFQPQDISVTSGGQHNFNLYAIVYGYVKTSLNQPIDDVIIRVYNNDILLNTGYTQSNGYYSILLDYSPTNGLLKVEKQGYKSAELSITSGGSNNFQLFALIAIIVGISDYASSYVNDLDYCDDDASDWYNHLNSIGYDCRVYGDNHPSHYPSWEDYGTEENVRDAIQSLSTITGSGDTVCFITAGHGGDKWFKQFLCMYDYNPYHDLGRYKENEIADDFENFANGVKLFFFFDNCHSGGILPSLASMNNAEYIYCAVACGEDGFAIENDTLMNGYWTYYFLEYAWIDHYSGDSDTALEDIFDYAKENYPLYGDNDAQEWDGDESSDFYLK